MSDSSLKFNNARSMSTGPTQTKKKKLVWKFLCGCGSDVETFGDVPVQPCQSVCGSFFFLLCQSEVSVCFGCFVSLMFYLQSNKQLKLETSIDANFYQCDMPDHDMTHLM